MQLNDFNNIHKTINESAKGSGFQDPEKSGKPPVAESNDPAPEQSVVDKFAGVSDKLRSYYIMKWAEKKGMDTDDAMCLAGYIRDGYMGSGAWNWRYVGMNESVQEMDDEVDTGPTWKDDLEDALDGYPEWAHEYIKDGVCPECGGNGYMDGDYENEDGEENDECNGMYNYDCDEGEIRDNTWADELKSKEPQAPKQPAPSKEQIMKIILDQYQELKNEADELRDAVGYRDSATQRAYTKAVTISNLIDRINEETN